MGITGLLPRLGFATKKSHVDSYQDSFFAVDFSGWIHCAARLDPECYVESLETKGSVDSKCIDMATDYIVSRCNQMLKGGNSRLYLVLDGQEHPLKVQTNNKRQDERLVSLTAARRFKEAGNKKKARSKYSSSVRIDADFSKRVVARLKRQFGNETRVHFVQSPREADAQLVKLCAQGITNAIITEVRILVCQCAIS
jgi:exonuclease-1